MRLFCDWPEIGLRLILNCCRLWSGALIGVEMSLGITQ